MADDELWLDHSVCPKINFSDFVSHLNLAGSGGMCLKRVETVEAKSRPQSAITVRVKGIPTRAKTMQKALPSVVIGTILP